jgi:Tol biopolymer transport system component
MSGSIGGKDESLGIWTVSVFTGALRHLREGACGAKASPDDLKIAYLDPVKDEIWLMGSNGDDPRRLLIAEKGSSFVRPDGRLEFSPDGRHLTYIKYVHDRYPQQVSFESLDLKDGKTTTVFSAPLLWDFCWRPDGRIIYSQWEAFPHQDHQNFWEIKTDPRTGRATDSPRRLSNWAGLELLSPFNLSATGKRLAFVKSRFGSDVYVSELKKNENRLLLPRRVTLDERWDRHPSWSGDNKAIYFSSNRKGTFDIYTQGKDELTAKEAVTGPEDEEKPQLSPDGSWLLYLSYPYPRMPVGTPPRPCRLMRMPVDGGPTQIVFNLGQPDRPWLTQDTPDFRCPTQSVAPCVLSETGPENDQIVFSAFDAATTRKQGIAKLSRKPGYKKFSWDLSPDGSRLAYCRMESDSFKINVLKLTGGPTREILVREWTQCQFLTWSMDGKGWFAGSYSNKGGSMLYVGTNGEAHFLQKSDQWYDSARPSPDGRYLTYTERKIDSNAWMVDNLP